MFDHVIRRRRALPASTLSSAVASAHHRGHQYLLHISMTFRNSYPDSIGGQRLFKLEQVSPNSEVDSCRCCCWCHAFTPPNLLPIAAEKDASNIRPYLCKSQLLMVTRCMSFGFVDSSTAKMSASVGCIPVFPGKCWVLQWALPYTRSAEFPPTCIPPLTNIHTDDYVRVA